jgi:hypothetical protein
LAGGASCVYWTFKKQLMLISKRLLRRMPVKSNEQECPIISPKFFVGLAAES